MFPGRFFALALIALTALSVLITGYGIYLENHAMQIPLIQILNEPGLYPGDPFVASLTRYGAPLWRLVALACRYVNEAGLLAVLFVITRMAAVAGAGLLAWALRPGSRLSLLGAMMMMASDPTPMIGAGTVLETIFEHTSLSIALFVLAFAAWHAGRYGWWSLCWVAGFFCNPLYGIFAAVYLAAVVLLGESDRAAWRRWIAPVAVALACVVPLLAWSYLSMKPLPYDREAWLLVNGLRAEHHMNPFAWSRWSWLRFGGLLGMSLLAVRFLWSSNRRLARFFAAGAAGCLVWLAMCLIAYWSQIPFLLLLHSARGTDFFYIFCAVGVPCLLAEPHRQGDAPIDMPPLLALLAFPFCFQPDVSRLLCALIPLGVVAAWKAPSINFRWAARLLFVTPALLAAAMVIDRDGAIYIRPDRALAEIAQWGREHTPPDAAFLIDPEWTEFRAMSRRPVFVTWKDAGAIPWQRDYAVEWLKRLRALGADLTYDDSKDEAQDRVDEAWEHMDDARVASIARQYGLAYWVTDEDTQSNYPEVHEAGDWRVLKIAVE